MQAKVEKSEEKEIICRKCNFVYFFWWVIFLVVLLIMFLCLTILDLEPGSKSSVLQFFFLAELVVAIVVFEEYMDIMIISKDGLRFESGILVKNNKISVKFKKSFIFVLSSFVLIYIILVV